MSTGAESTAARIKVTSVNAEGVILTAALVSLAGTNIFTVPVSDTISLQGGNGTGATISTASLSYGIKEVTVTAPGNNYKVLLLRLRLLLVLAPRLLRRLPLLN